MDVATAAMLMTSRVADTVLQVAGELIQLLLVIGLGLVLFDLFERRRSLGSLEDVKRR